MPRLALPAFSVIKDQRCLDIKQFDEKYPSHDTDVNTTKTRQRLFSYPMCNSILYRTNNSPLPKVQEESSSCADETPKDLDSIDGDESSFCKLCHSHQQRETKCRPRSVSLPSKKEHLEQLRHLNHIVSQSTARFANYKLDREFQSKRLCRSASLNRERKHSDLPNIQELGDVYDDKVSDKIVADEVEKLHNFKLTSCPRKESCPARNKCAETASSDNEDDSSDKSRVKRPTARERRTGYRAARAFSAPLTRP